jgi:hypothetical protein
VLNAIGNKTVSERLLTFTVGASDRPASQYAALRRLGLPAGAQFDAVSLFT